MCPRLAVGLALFALILFAPGPSLAPALGGASLAPAWGLYAPLVGILGLAFLAGRLLPALRLVRARA